MEYEVMRRKLDAYRKPNGQFRCVNGDLLIELLRMGEMHTGPSIDYFLGNYEGLTQFLKNPNLLIDNNISERQLRCPVIGRKTCFLTSFL